MNGVGRAPMLLLARWRASGILIPFYVLLGRWHGLMAALLRCRLGPTRMRDLPVLVLAPPRVV